jgi:MFS family permease
MKAVARLVWTYFMGTPVLLAFTFAGLILIAVDCYILLTQPHSGDLLWIAVLGVIAFFIGSSLMPVTFGRLSRSHSIGVLPGGRVKLLASAFITIVIVAIPFGITGPAASVSDMISLPELMRNPAAQAYVLQLAAIMFTSAVLTASWMYLAMWFLTSERNMAGLFKALLVIMVVIFAPAKDIQDLTVTITWNLQQIAALWIVFGAGFLLWPRYKAARARRSRERFTGLASVLTGRTAGREFDAMLGTSNPWLLVVSLALPLAIAARFVRETPTVWLYFLTIFSVVTGAYSGQAGERSRALWLRGGWSREALFSAVERSVWRHNGHVLGALMLVTIGIGTYAGFSMSLLLSGLPLTVLGTLLSTYLGLTITRGLRWLEITSGVAVMVLLMALSVLVAREHVDLVTVVALEAGLVVFAVVLRFVARRRWTRIDWMMCRPERVLVMRGA